MKSKNTQQELLLVTTCSLFKKQWCNKNEEKSSFHYSHVEELEEACWNGGLEDLLPEVIEKGSSGKRLFLWHIRHGNTFMQIELSEAPVSLDYELSIDTQCFMDKLYYN
jgi:hypothetical protein